MATISKKTPVTVGLVIAMCVSATWVGMTYQALGNRIDKLESKIDNLVTRAEFVSLKTAVDVKTKDRWCKVNDLSFMREFCRMNSLIMVPHERIATLSIRPLLVGATWKSQ